VPCMLRLPLCFAAEEEAFSNTSLHACSLWPWSQVYSQHGADGGGQGLTNRQVQPRCSSIAISRGARLRDELPSLPNQQQAEFEVLLMHITIEAEAENASAAIINDRAVP
jgi:hypothetical protein